MSLLEQDITKNKKLEKDFIKLEFETNNSEKFKVKHICNKAVYSTKLEGYHLLDLYYLVLKKSYCNERSHVSKSRA